MPDLQRDEDDQSDASYVDYPDTPSDWNDNNDDYFEQHPINSEQVTPTAQDPSKASFDDIDGAEEGYFDGSTAEDDEINRGVLRNRLEHSLDRNANDNLGRGLSAGERLDAELLGEDDGV